MNNEDWKAEYANLLREHDAWARIAVHFEKERDEARAAGLARLDELAELVRVVGRYADCKDSRNWEAVRKVLEPLEEVAEWSV